MAINEWVFVMTGGVLAAAFALFGLFGIQWPFLVAAMIFVASVLLAVFNAGRKTHNERRKLIERMKPKMEILDTSDGDQDYCRVVVRNCSSGLITVRLMLESICPQEEGLQLPLALLPQGQSEDRWAIIRGHETRSFNVFLVRPVISEQIILLCVPYGTRGFSMNRQNYSISVYAICKEGEGFGAATPIKHYLLADQMLIHTSDEFKPTPAPPKINGIQKFILWWKTRPSVAILLSAFKAFLAALRQQRKR